LDLDKDDIPTIYRPYGNRRLSIRRDFARGGDPLSLVPS